MNAKVEIVMIAVNDIITTSSLVDDDAEMHIEEGSDVTPPGIVS